MVQLWLLTHLQHPPTLRPEIVSLTMRWVFISIQLSAVGTMLNWETKDNTFSIGGDHTIGRKICQAEGVQGRLEGQHH